MRSRSCSLAQLRHGELAYRLDIAEIVTHLVEISLRELANVLAAIPVLGKRRVLTQDLLRARAHRHREILDLLARVVVVELARHAAPCHSSSVAIGIAQRSLPAVADMQRTGRVRGHELDHDALAFTLVASAEAVPRR